MTHIPEGLDDAFTNSVKIKDNCSAKKFKGDGSELTGIATGNPEGTAVLSTGEGGATKYLREDGDGTCSWQTPSAGGDVTAAANLTDETIVQGDGGAKGVKTSTATIAQIEAAVTHYGLTNEHIDWTGATDNLSTTGTLHSDGNITTGGSVDGVDVAGMSAFVTSNSTHRGDATGADHSTLVASCALNTAKETNVTTNITVAEAPTNVEIQSSDGSNDTIAAANVTNAGVMTTTMYDEHVVNNAKVTYDDAALVTATVASCALNTAKVTYDDAALVTSTVASCALNTTHRADNTQAHSDYLLNSGADIAVGPLTITADNSTADQAYVPMVLYNTDDTPPAASGFPVGTIYIQYTA